MFALGCTGDNRISFQKAHSFDSKLLQAFAMRIWKFTPATQSRSEPALIHSPALILSDSAAGAFLLLPQRLAGHSARSAEVSAAGISAMPEQDRDLAKLVTTDWPVSLLTGALDLPARRMPKTLPDADCLTVTRYREEELEAELERMLSDDTQACFAVVDGARFPGLAELLDASSLEHACLFRGTSRETAGAAAPWIIRIGSEDAVSRRLVRAALGKQGGYPAAPTMILNTEHSIDEVGRHFRRLARVRAESDGRWLYFRYADPCTMDDLRASMNAEDAAAVLGPYAPVVLHPAGAFRLAPRHLGSEARSNSFTFRLADRHVRAMRHRQRVRFAQIVARDLAALVPNMKRSAIEDLVGRGMDLCRDTGIFQQDSTAGYILLSGLLGPRFTQSYSRYAPILDPRRSETERKTMIHSTLSEVQKRGRSND